MNRFFKKDKYSFSKFPNNSILLMIKAMKGICSSQDFYYNAKEMENPNFKLEITLPKNDYDDFETGANNLGFTTEIISYKVNVRVKK